MVLAPGWLHSQQLPLSRVRTKARAAVTRAPFHPAGMSSGPTFDPLAVRVASLDCSSGCAVGLSEESDSGVHDFTESAELVGVEEQVPGLVGGCHVGVPFWVSRVSCS
jgi:hypothetical protein